MKTFFRLLVVAVCVVVLSFCVFGFVATFEPLPTFQRWVWRTVYGFIGMASLCAMVRPLRCEMHRLLKR